MKEVNLYIDTSIKGPKRRDGSYMYILDYTTEAKKQHQVNDICRIPNSTENMLTLEAITAALSRLKLPCTLHIYLECRHVANAFRNGWLENWKSNGWKNAKGETVADAERWQQVCELLDKHEYHIHMQERHEYKSWMKWKITGS